MPDVTLPDNGALTREPLVEVVGVGVGVGVVGVGVGLVVGTVGVPPVVVVVGGDPEAALKLVPS